MVQTKLQKSLPQLKFDPILFKMEDEDSGRMPLKPSPHFNSCRREQAKQTTEMA